MSRNMEKGEDGKEGQGPMKEVARVRYILLTSPAFFPSVSAWAKILAESGGCVAGRSQHDDEPLIAP